MQQEFPVSAAAFDRTVDHLECAPPLLTKPDRHSLQRRVRAAAYNPTLVDILPPNLKLRFDQQNCLLRQDQRHTENLGN